MAKGEDADEQEGGHVVNDGSILVIWLNSDILFSMTFKCGMIHIFGIASLVNGPSSFMNLDYSM